MIPSQPERVIRPSTFIMAGLLATGHHISLTILAIANIFRCMLVLSTSRDPSFCDEVIPFYYIHGWAHLYWVGFYSSVMSQKMREELPLLVDIAGAKAIALFPKLARENFRSSTRFLR